jgi:hypothetical protein
MRTIEGDIRQALQRLLRRPAFAAVAIATLAVTIGASAAFFTLLDTFALRQLPVDSHVPAASPADDGVLGRHRID